MLRCDAGSVALAPTNDLQDEAVLDGGPMDGNRQAIDAGTNQLCVAMSDGQQHRYLRTDEFQTLDDGHVAVVFRWIGRYFGPA